MWEGGRENNFGEVILSGTAWRFGALQLNTLRDEEEGARTSRRTELFRDELLNATPFLRGIDLWRVGAQEKAIT
jgi:hypothetical protein